MASMTVAEMRAYLRAYLDSDEEEFPNALVDVWLSEGASRIQRAFAPWSFYVSSWALSTSSASVDYADLASVDGGTPERVTSVEGDNWLLRWVPHEEAIARNAWGTPTAANVTEWSTDGSTLYLWPNPDDTQDFTIRGYRAPIEAIDDTDVVDLPAEFHPLVCEWMLARAYEQQDDEIMSTQKFNRFEQQLEIFRRRYTRTPAAGVSTIGGGCYNYTLPSRMQYDWE